jgi:hypothetical protein
MQPVIYPTGYLKEPLASALVLYMEGFSLCLAGGMNMNTGLSPYVEKGIVTPVRTRRPHPPDIHRLLQEYVMWGSEHFGEIPTMKTRKILADWEKEESCPTIVHNIRKAIVKDPSAQNALEGQSHLLLHLAQRLEEDDEAVESLMAQVEKAEDSLDASLGLEHARFQRARAGISDSSLQAVDALAPGLVRAWAYLFGAQLPPDAVLVTPHASVHHYLAEQCQMLMPDPTVEVPERLEGRMNKAFTVGPVGLPAPKLANHARILEMRNTWAEPIRNQVHTALLSLVQLLQNEALSNTQEAVEGVFNHVKEAIEVTKKLSNVPDNMGRTLLLTFTVVTGASVHKVLQAISGEKMGFVTSSFANGSGSLLILAQMA